MASAHLGVVYQGSVASPLNSDSLLHKPFLKDFDLDPTSTVLVPKEAMEDQHHQGLLIGGKTTSAGGFGGNVYEVVKSDSINPALLITTSNISGLKEPWQNELEDDDLNGCKGTGVSFPRGTVIAIWKPKSNPIVDIAADSYYDEKMKKEIQE